ncbi:MAG: dienelactone hydrolase family protein, partial [Tistlia sp.]
MASLTIPASDGSGSFGGYLALPGKSPAAAILVIQEIFGVNKVMRELCDSYAAEGYLAFAPDLFWRIQPGVDITDRSEAEWQQAFALMQKFDVDKGVEDLKAALAALRGHEAATGKVGTVGYCLGGKLAFLMATRSDADCNVSYYGVGLADHLGEIGAIARPLMLHVAREDGFVPKEQQDKVAAAL